MDLSIIVPVYNVEKYVRPCIESIFRQGLDDNNYEIIIVNDGSTDNSMKNITDIISKHNNIRIINQENQGLSVARNNGIAVAEGEYIQFIDSDDLLIENTVLFLLDKAISSQAELVVADFIKMNDSEISECTPESFQQGNGNVEELTGKELLARRLHHGFSCVWRTLYRRDFLNKNNIRFIPNIYFEDTPFTYQCQSKADKCLKVDWKFIIYRIGNQSITSSFNKKKGLDYCTVIAKIWEISEQDNLSNELKLKIRNDIFSFFSSLLYFLSSDKKTTHIEKVQILNYLNQLEPNLSFKNGVKQRIVTFIYHRMPSLYLTLRIFYAQTMQDYLWRIRKFVRKTKP